MKPRRRILQFLGVAAACAGLGAPSPALADGGPTTTSRTVAVTDRCSGQEFTGLLEETTFIVPADNGVASVDFFTQRLVVVTDDGAQFTFHSKTHHAIIEPSGAVAQLFLRHTVRRMTNSEGDMYSLHSAARRIFFEDGDFRGSSRIEEGCSGPGV